MKCAVADCNDHYDETKQSSVCPHQLLDAPALPQGGPRIPEDVRARIDDAYRMQDTFALVRFMGHGNVAVRSYAKQMSEVLEGYLGLRGW
jgi:hypothetical protein